MRNQDAPHPRAFHAHVPRDTNEPSRIAPEYHVLTDFNPGYQNFSDMDTVPMVAYFGTRKGGNN